MIAVNNALAFLLSAGLLSAGRMVAADPIRPRVVVAVTFDQGDNGEFQRWVDREKLTEPVPFPSAFPIVRMNKEQTVIGMVTGMGAPVAAASVMQLGLDSRFDLSKSYWLVNGIAGVDPNDASLGSAAWAHYVIDGDLLWELDSREAPRSWAYGRLGVFAHAPNQIPKDPIDRVMYELNHELVDWAFGLTKDVKLIDTPEMAAYRKKYAGLPKATLPPFVFLGDSLGSSNWWHGSILNRWANDWVKLWTGGKGNYAMTNREDNGIVVAVERLAAGHRADFRRLLFLRTASNYSMQAPGQTAESSLHAPLVGTTPALEACYRVGAVVVHELVNHWTQWENSVP